MENCEEAKEIQEISFNPLCCHLPCGRVHPPFTRFSSSLVEVMRHWSDLHNPVSPVKGGRFGNASQRLHQHTHTHTRVVVYRVPVSGILSFSYNRKLKQDAAVAAAPLERRHVLICVGRYR